MGNTETLFGYRIVDITEGSPAEKSGLKKFLDFIIAVNGAKLSESQISLHEIIKLNINCEITLDVFSILDKSSREVKITPQEWNGEGTLGVALRYENAYEALEQIYHVTNVIENGPSHTAGIRSNIDYILGSESYYMRDLSELEILINSKPELPLMIYNTEAKSVRKVTVKTGYPNSEPSLGLELAIGALHSLN